MWFVIWLWLFGISSRWTMIIIDQHWQDRSRLFRCSGGYLRAINETAMRYCNIVWCREQLITVNNFRPNVVRTVLLSLFVYEHVNREGSKRNEIIWPMGPIKLSQKFFLMSLFDAQLIIKLDHENIYISTSFHSIILRISKWKFCVGIEQPWCYALQKTSANWSTKIIVLER